jgi:hypothetical protein
LKEGGMNMKKTALSALLITGLLIFGGGAAGAQEFGFPVADAASGQTNSGAETGGSLSFSLLAFPAELLDGDFTHSSALPEARLSVSAAGSMAEGFLGLRLDKDLLENDPAGILDEAWLRIFAGKSTTIQGGLMRVSWGRADSLSVLDVLNPRDLTDLTLRDEKDRKIAVPMLSLTQALGDRASADFAYLPFFEGDRIATSGAWVPSSLAAGKATLVAAMTAQLYNSYKASVWATTYSAAYSQALTASGNNVAISNAAAIAAADAQVSAVDSSLQAQAASEAADALANPFYSPDTRRLDYGQGGVRLTTGLGGIDFGLQYFYGYLTVPAYDINPVSIAAAGGKIPVSWNPYHQIGADLAFAAAGFNVRAEAALNLTGDADGTETLVYNRNLAWSAGFDRSLFAGIDLNLQAMGKLRLNHDKIDASPASLDIEARSDITSTQIAALLSRGFMQDRVKVELLGMLGVEKQDYMIEPGISVTFGDAEIALRGRYFGGDAAGDLGQYNKKSYVSLSSKFLF